MPRGRKPGLITRALFDYLEAHPEGVPRKDAIDRMVPMVEPEPALQAYIRKYEPRATKPVDLNRSANIRYGRRIVAWQYMSAHHKRGRVVFFDNGQVPSVRLRVL